MTNKFVNDQQLLSILIGLKNNIKTLIDEGRINETDKLKITKIIIDGDGTKFLSNNGNYITINYFSNDAYNKLNSIANGISTNPTTKLFLSNAGEYESIADAYSVMSADEVTDFIKSIITV